MTEESEEAQARRERVMRQLAEMLQGPPPSTEGGGVSGGGVEGAIAALGLGLSAEDTEEVAGAVREGPDPAEAEALFRALLGGFQDWQRRAGAGGEEGQGQEPEGA